MLKNSEFKYNEKYLPKIVRLESCIKCQLNCVCCDIKKFYEEFPPAIYYLTFDNFKNFINKNSFVKIIELSNNGEMFLNPDLKKIIEYANKKKVVLMARTGVNFNNVSDDVLEALVKYKFHSMYIAIDGASQKTYQEYRVGGNFNQVIENICKLNSLKKKYNSKYPILYYQFIIFGHNEHEIPLAKQLAKKLNMKLYFKRNYFHDYSPIKNPEFVAKELGLDKIVVEKTKENDNIPLNRMDTCTHLWFEPQIQCDGTFLGCCSQYFDTNINVFELGLEKTMQHYKIQYAKDILCAKKEFSDDSICAKCPFYLYRKKTRSFITDEMINITYEHIKKKIDKLYIY